jgi:hypothetical protein
MPRSTHSSHRPYPPFRSALAQGVLILAALAGVFLAGSIRQGATGIFLTAAGAAMVLLAPNRAVPWRFWALGGGLIACASLCLLPGAWFHIPLWRVGLDEYQGLPPLPLVSLAPRETIYWLMLLAGAVLTGLFSLGHPIRTDVKVYLALLGAVGVAAYAGVALYAKMTGWEYPFTAKGGFTTPDFGFFPNRNHTAALLVTGAVLSLGIIREAWSGRRPVVFMLAGASMAVCAYALLFQSTSRGGIVFLVVGALVWVAMLGRGHLSTPLVVSAGVLGMLVVGIFFATESPARTRVLELLGLYETRSAENVKTLEVEPKAPAAGSAMSDFRLKVFQDAFRIVRDYPITGTGLGTYGYVSPFYVDASIGEAIPIHPESDWVMCAAESGLPFVLCVAALLFVLIRDMLPLRQSPTWPLRWGIAAAALAAILHGIVDVPLHRVEIGWWVLVLAGLAFGIPTPTGTERNAAWLVQRLVFGAAGAGMLALGVLLIRSQWFGEVPFPPYRARIVVDQMRQLSEAGRFDDAINLARSEIPLSPMAVGLYRELGFRELKNGGNPIVADAAFAAERALNPVSAQLAVDQGWLWLRDDPMRTAELWVEAMKKHLRIQKGGGYAYPAEFYGRMLGQARQHPEMLAKLEECSRLTPELWLVWISHTRGESFEDASKNPEFLAALDAGTRKQFLESWWNGGDKEALEEFLAANPDWADDAWSVRIQQMVARKEFQAAVEAVQSRYGIDLSLPELDASQLAASEPPMGLAASVAYYFAKGNPVSARRMIAESIQAQDAEGSRLQCALAVRSGDWEAAWSAMQKLLAGTNRSRLP